MTWEDFGKRSNGKARCKTARRKNDKNIKNDVYKLVKNSCVVIDKTGKTGIAYWAKTEMADGKIKWDGLPVSCLSSIVTITHVRRSLLYKILPHGVPNIFSQSVPLTLVTIFDTMSMTPKSLSLHILVCAIVLPVLSQSLRRHLPWFYLRYLSQPYLHLSLQDRVPNASGKILRRKAKLRKRRTVRSTSLKTLHHHPLVKQHLHLHLLHPCLLILWSH